MDNEIVGITMGDAAGIAPEIICKALLRKETYENGRPFVLGDARVMQNIIDLYRLPLRVNGISDLSHALFSHGTIDVLDYRNIDMSSFAFGKLDAGYGDAAVRYTLDACHMCMDGKIGAMVSGPLNKAAMRMAGYHYEGVTQIIGETTGAKDYGMLLLLDDIRVMMYSNHCSLADACTAVRKDKVLSKLRLLDEGLRELLGKPQPYIGVSALNPHCGEGGLFGRQEIDEIAPAVEEAKASGIRAEGPVPADTIFVEAKKGKYDAVIAMYHDQANIVMKLLGFGSVVTLLVGVPIIRTSTGHGTAFDIAGKNIADEENIFQSILAAEKLAKRRKATHA